MKHILFLILFSSMASLTMANEDYEDTITDQQRCEEWAVMDGIDEENKQEYMSECISNLQYDEGINDENGDAIVEE